MPAKLSETIQIILEVADRSRGKFKKTAGEIKELGDKSKRSSANVTKAEKAIKKAGDASSKAGKKHKQNKTQVNALGNAYKGAAGKIGGFVAAMAAVGLPIMEAAQFERKMSEVKAITGATEEEFKALSDTAENLGRKTEYSATQSAEGMKMLSMAGLNAKQAIDALPGALDLALIGTISLGESADYVTNIMGGFGQEAKDINHIVDVMANTATSANANVSELAEALSYGAAPAKAMGVSLELTAAAMGALHDAGIKGTRAGTGIRGIMSQLAAPTDKAKAALKKLNVEISYFEDGSLDFAKTFRDLRDAEMGLAEANALFGRIAGNSGLIIAKSIGKIEKLKTANEESEGAAREMAEIYNQNLIGAFKNFKSAVSGLAIEIGKKLLPALTSIVSGITSVVNSLTDWMKAHPTLTNAILVTVGALTTLRVALLAARTAMIAFNLIAGTSTLVRLAPMLATATAGFYTFATGAGVATTAMGAAALSIAGVAAAVGALWAAYKAGEWIAMGQHWKEIREQTEANAEANKKLADRFKEISDATGVTVTSMDELDQAVKDGKIHFDETAAAWVKGSADMQAAAKKTGEVQKQAVKEATDEMKETYKKYVNDIKALQDKIWGREKSLAATLREMGRKGMSDVGAWRDRRKEADEYYTAAKKAFAEAQRLSKDGYGDEAAKQFERAQEYAKDAQDSYKSLNEEVKSGERTVLSQANATKLAIKEVSKAGDLEVQIMKDQARAIKESAQQMDKLTGGQLSQEFGKVWDDTKTKIKEVDQTTVQYGKTWSNVWQDAATASNRATNSMKQNIDEVRRKAEQLSRSWQQAGYQFTAQQSTGGIAGVPAYASGGFTRRSHFLPGFGGGDKIRALLEAGEFIMNKSAVRKYGLELMYALNSGNLNLGSLIKAQTGGLISQMPIPQMAPFKFQAGGQVPEVGGGEMIRLDLNLPTEGPAIQTTMPKVDVPEFMRQLENMGRRAS